MPSRGLILGLWDGHDAGAAAVLDGQLVAAVSEERLTRVKKQGGWPGRSIEAALKLAGAGPADVVAVGLAGTAGRLPARLMDRRYAERPPQQEDPMAWPAQVFAAYQERSARSRIWAALERRGSTMVVRQRLLRLGVEAAVTVVDHHRCHALGAVAALDGRREGDDGAEPDALVLTMDGYGDGLSAAVWRWSGRRHELTRLHATGVGASPGLLYGALNAALGFAPGEEGKVTGLAASAVAMDARKGRENLDFSGSIGVLDGALRVQRRGAVQAMRRALKRGVPRQLVARALQDALEGAVLAVARHWLRATQVTRLGLAGGLFHNVSLNGKLAALPLDELAVFGAMGDAGLSAGAGWHAWGGRPALGSLRVGPLPGELPGGVAVTAAEVGRLLAGDKLVAVCRGRLEFGPRALGGRSLLFDPRNTRRASAVGVALGRPRFMPFAPAVAAGAWTGWFDMPRERVPRSATEMTLALPVRDASWCPAAIAGDGTVRPQLVDRDNDRWLADVIDAFGRETGVFALVNTSLNRHREPIVTTAAQALDAATRAQADALVVGDRLHWLQPAARG